MQEALGSISTQIREVMREESLTRYLKPGICIPAGLVPFCLDLG
jgi:hypothetical protein